jgi:hypothetical protein
VIEIPESDEVVVTSPHTNTNDRPGRKEAFTKPTITLEDDKKTSDSASTHSLKTSESGSASASPVIAKAANLFPKAQKPTKRKIDSLW